MNLITFIMVSVVVAPTHFTLVPFRLSRGGRTVRVEVMVKRAVPFTGTLSVMIALNFPSLLFRELVFVSAASNTNIVGCPESFGSTQVRLKIPSEI